MRRRPDQVARGRHEPLAFGGCDNSLKNIDRLCRENALAQSLAGNAFGKRLAFMMLADGVEHFLLQRLKIALRYINLTGRDQPFAGLGDRGFDNIPFPTGSSLNVRNCHALPAGCVNDQFNRFRPVRSCGDELVQKLAGVFRVAFPMFSRKIVDDLAAALWSPAASSCGE